MESDEIEAVVLGALVQWAGPVADLKDCREAAAAVTKVLVAAGYTPLGEVTR